MQLDACAYITHGFFICCLRQPVVVPAIIFLWVCLQRIILADNDAVSSPPSSVLHAGFFLYLLNVRIYIRT